MKITYFINTMVLIEGKNSKILIDPWVTYNCSFKACM